MLARVSERYVHALASRFANHRRHRLHGATVSTDAGRIPGMIAEETLYVIHLDGAVPGLNQRADSLLARHGILQTDLEICRGRVALAQEVVGMGQISSPLIAQDFRTGRRGFRIGNVTLSVAENEVLVGR